MRSAPVALAGAILLVACGKGDDGASRGEMPVRSDASAAIAPTAAMGEAVFKRCVACHTIDAGGSNGVGPNLHAIVGRKVASHPGFTYSDAMRTRGGAWDEAALDAYLEAPTRSLPGTRMAFAGIADPSDREALILYLAQQSD